MLFSRVDIRTTGNISKQYHNALIGILWNNHSTMFTGVRGMELTFNVPDIAKYFIYT